MSLQVDCAPDAAAAGTRWAAAPAAAAAGADAEEAARRAALQRLNILDTAPTPVFDALVGAAAVACSTPIALLSLIDSKRQWFKANVGLPGVSETPRSMSFCSHAISSSAVLEVPDARHDPRFADNPFVTGEPHFRFYAGAPVETGGVRIGTLCVIDRHARELLDAERTLLEALARAASAALDEHARQEATARALGASEWRYRAIVEEQGEVISLASRDGTLTFVNAAYARQFGLAPGVMIGRKLLDFVDAADRTAVAEHWARAWHTGGAHAQVNRVSVEPQDPVRWVAWVHRALLDAEGRVDCMQSVGRDVTAQKLAEEALVVAEARHGHRYDSTPAMLHSLDFRGRLSAVSDRWLEALGYARDEVLGRPADDFLTPDSARRARRTVLPAFYAAGRCDRAPLQFVRKDGTLLDVLLSATLERDAGGEPLRSLSVLEDASDQRRLQAELGRTQSRLDAIVDNVPALLGHWDAAGVTQFVNREFQAAVGLPVETIVGHTLESVFAAVDPLAWEPMATAVGAVVAGRRQDFELPMLTTSGLRQLHMTLVPDIADGSVCGFYGMAHDVTGRKALELRLSDSEQRYRSLFDHLNSGFALHEVIVDPDGRPRDYRYLAVNDAFCQLFQQGADQLVGRCVSEIIPTLGTAPERWVERLGRVAIDGVPQHFEHHFANSDRWHAVVAFRPAPGQFATIVQDVTERKHAEFALQAALRDKEVLLKEVHHRVKNNLHMVLGLLDLQRHALADGAARAVLDDSLRRVRAMALVHDKLYRSGSLAAVSLADYTRELLLQIGDSAGAGRHGVRLEADVAPVQTALDHAISYGLLVSELVGNALQHAFSAVPAGDADRAVRARAGGTVRVVLERREGGAWLEVRDDGIGFPAGVDLDAARSVGLQLARSLAGQLGGSLAVRNDRGAVFCALLDKL